MKYVFLLFITIQSCLMNGQKNENVVKKDTLIANMDLSKDSTVIPKFIHKRYEGNFAGQSAFIEFTVTQSDKPELGSGFVSSAYLNYSQVCGMSRYIELYKINEHIINSKINDKNKINLNINGSNEGIGFYMPYSDTNFICSNGFLDKRSSTFKGGIEAMGNEFIFEFHENRSISADNSLLPKFELALKLENNHTIDNYNIFQYTYYSSKVLSGIFAFKDSKILLNDFCTL